MYSGKNWNSEYTPSRPGHYGLMQAALGTGPGTVNLDKAPQIHQQVMVRQSQVPTTHFDYEDPAVASMSYTQPQAYYQQSLQPVQALDTNRNTHTKNVAVKER
jgi:hypothetical protein